MSTQQLNRIARKVTTQVLAALSQAPAKRAKKGKFTRYNSTTLALRGERANTAALSEYSRVRIELGRKLGFNTRSQIKRYCAEHNLRDLASIRRHLRKLG